MTANQFAEICSEYTVSPSVALDNENIVKALREGATVDDIRRLFESEF